MVIRWKDTDKSMVVLWKFFGYFIRNIMFLIVKPAQKRPVLRSSEDRPKIVLRSSENRPNQKNKKRFCLVLRLPEDCPKIVRRLSAYFCKKRTTPFGGMALSYIHSPRPYISLFTSLFHTHI
jgi:hypothetical protein